jgi:pimeloyl-ACP methyl ester carboxylesterase
MAMAKAGDLNIEYYVEGSGPPLLMIMGLGGQASSWGEPVLEGLQRQFTTIRFSNRGAGATDKPADGYTIRQMGDDAAGLLDTIGIGKSHVFGISMGGMIAQEVVLNHPRKVQGLVLGCTNCGAAHSVSVSAQTLAQFGQIMQLPIEERIQRYWEICVTPEFMQSRADFLARIIELGMASYAVETFGRQFGAVQSFDLRPPVADSVADADPARRPRHPNAVETRRYWSWMAGSRVRIVRGPGTASSGRPEEVVEDPAFLSKVPVGRRLP